MHQETFAAFQDELIKIAELFRGSAEEWDRMQHGSRENKVKKVLHTADKFDAERAALAPTQVTPAPSKGTVVARPPKGTSVIPAPHAPAGVPHPATVPGGGAGLLRRGATLARAHAAPLAIGAGATALGAMALSHMRNRNAASR